VPRTLDNTREYDPNSYLTANPESLASLAARRKIVRQEAAVTEDSEEESDDEDDEEQDEEPQAGPSRLQGRKARIEGEDQEMDARFEMDEDMPDAEAGEEDDAEAEAEGDEEQEEAEAQAPPAYMAPPRILLTTSPSPTKATYEFLAELRSVFPGAEVRKRLKGRGFEMGRIARWAAKREYAAMVIVNEDHKKPSE
jgi:ribosome production factor 1